MKDRAIYVTKHGSHAYGLNTETSDLDIKGVFIAPPEYLLGFLKRIEQIEEKVPNDLVYYELRKFFNLAAGCNPNIIEVLHTDDEDILEMTSLGEDLCAARDEFLSTKAKFTFSGYAMSQLKRIRAHHRWMENPPLAPPTRQEFDLPEFTVISRDQVKAAESLVLKKIQSWEPHMDALDEAAKIGLSTEIENFLVEIAVGAGASDVSAMQFRVAARSLGYDDNFLLLLDKERGYAGAKHEWDQYLNWTKTRNPARAELERKFGYDTKHAMHLVRLMRMGEEILTTGKVVVKRPDREELLAIRNNGIWTYDQLIEWAQAMDEKLNVAYASGKSPLPRDPPRAKLDALCISLVESAWRKHG